MKFALTLVLALAAWPLAAQSFDPAEMDEDQRAAFGQAVRSYLLENPEVLMEAIAVLEMQEAEAAAAADADLVSRNREALMEGGDWVGGNPDGNVTVVEFIDYRCGYCRRAHPEMEALIASDDQIRLIRKEFPILGEQSTDAARFALAARSLGGDDVYAEVSDALMTMEEAVGPESLRDIAEDQGLNWEEVQDAMASASVTSQIQENLALGQAMSIQGTPTFVFGDQLVRGYVPLAAMEDLVAEERG